MTDQQAAPTREDEATRIAAYFIEAEGGQIVRDMAGHVGDEIHELLKRHGMTMTTAAGAIGVGMLAGVQVLNETLEFAVRSVDTEAEKTSIIAGVAAFLGTHIDRRLAHTARPDAGEGFWVIEQKCNPPLYCADRYPGTSSFITGIERAIKFDSEDAAVQVLSRSRLTLEERDNYRVAQHGYACRPDAGDEVERAAAFQALDRFITDHQGNDDTTEGMDVDRLARAAVANLRAVVSASLVVCHSGDDDCTNGRVVTIDPDAFDSLNAALDAIDADNITDTAEAEDCLTGEEAWDILVNVDDRTSPEEYPDMCLITRDELIEFIRRRSPAAMREGVDRGMVEAAGQVGDDRQLGPLWRSVQAIHAKAMSELWTVAHYRSEMVAALSRKGV